MPRTRLRTSRIRTWAALAAVVLLLAGCSRRPVNPLTATPAPIRVAWAAPDLSVDLGGGWTATRCQSTHVALCIDRDGTPAGHILMEDLPSIGEELTASQDQVQATLAVRTQTIYQKLRADRTAACGEGYRIDTSVPKPVAVAGITGLRYEASGTQDGRMVERTIGFRVFREGIETLIEATAIQPGSCLTPEEPTFSVEQLRAFEPLLARLVAGSVLPEATEYPDLPSQPGGSRDPRLARAPTNGVGISHGLGSKP